MDHPYVNKNASNSNVNQTSLDHQISPKLLHIQPNTEQSTPLNGMPDSSTIINSMDTVQPFIKVPWHSVVHHNNQPMLNNIGTSSTVQMSTYGVAGIASPENSSPHGNMLDSTQHDDSVSSVLNGDTCKIQEQLKQLKKQELYQLLQATQSRQKNMSAMQQWNEPQQRFNPQQKQPSVEWTSTMGAHFPLAATQQSQTVNVGLPHQSMGQANELFQWNQMHSTSQQQRKRYKYGVEDVNRCNGRIRRNGLSDKQGLGYGNGVNGRLMVNMTDSQQGVNDRMMGSKLQHIVPQHGASDTTMRSNMQYSLPQQNTADTTMRSNIQYSLPQQNTADTTMRSNIQYSLPQQNTTDTTMRSNIQYSLPQQNTADTTMGSNVHHSQKSARSNMNQLPNQSTQTPKDNTATQYSLSEYSSLLQQDNKQRENNDARTNANVLPPKQKSNQTQNLNISPAGTIIQNETQDTTKKLNPSQIHPPLALSNSFAPIIHRFYHTPFAPVKTVNTQEDFMLLLRQMNNLGSKYQDCWVRCYQSQWIKDLFHELTPKQMKTLAAPHAELSRYLIPETDFLGRWGVASGFASSVLDAWFENKSLKEVIKRASDLGHFDLPSGFMLNGSYIEKVINKGCPGEVSVEELLPAVETLAGNTVSMYTSQDLNRFLLEPQVTVPKSNFRTILQEKLSKNQAVGSLNTTFYYSKRKLRSGVDMLDQYYQNILGIEKEPSVKINRQLYLIWKFKGYITAHHQDVHVPPHFTLYNQSSGTSSFHFLPLLVGLFVTYVGKYDPVHLPTILEQLDEMKIGTVATIHANQALLIMPFGSHGVWVPRYDKNEKELEFKVSLIRALELYSTDIDKEFRNRLKGEEWCKVPVDENLAKMSRSQDLLHLATCNELDIPLEDWNLSQQVLWNTLSRS